MPEAREHHLKVERTARYYTLGDERNKSKELWIVLHGYRNLGRHFIEWFSPIASDAFIVAPEALSRFYTKGSGGPESASPVGASWMTREDRLNEIEDHVAYLDRLYEHITETRPDKLILLGFSQGCPAVMRWVAKGNVKPDAVLVWSGDVPRDLDFDAYKAKSASIRTLMVYAKNDPLLDTALYDEGEALLKTNGISFETVTFDGGHEVPASILQNVRDLLTAKTQNI